MSFSDFLAKFLISRFESLSDKIFKFSENGNSKLVSSIEYKIFKIFRITKDVYRGKHKNHGKVWNLIAGLVNLRYGDSMI